MRLSRAFLLCLCVLLNGGLVGAQEKFRNQNVASGAPTITIATTGERVRFTAPSQVVRLRVEVFSESGTSLFDISSKGNVFDWTLLDGNGARVGDGLFLCVVRVKSLSGKISQRAGNVSVQGGVVTLRPEAAQLTPSQQQAVGPFEENAVLTVLPESEVPAATVVAHDGQVGQVTSTTGALTFRTGDVFAGKDKEQMRITEDGSVGIGTDKPQAKLDVAGDIRSSGSLRLDKGVEFADGTVQTTGLSGRKDEDGNLLPNVGGIGTQNRLAKWTDDAGTLGNSIVVDTGNGLQLTAAANSSVDTNLLSTSASSSTIGMIASPAPAFLANNGPYFAMRGNTYSALANQRGLFSISTGNVANPVGAEGSIVFLTGADQVRMFINPTGKVGIGTTTPAFKLHVADESDRGLRVTTAIVGGTVASFGANGDFKIDRPFCDGCRFSIKEDGRVTIGGVYPVVAGGMLNITGGAQGDGGGDPKAMSFEYKTGGFRHWIRTRHNDSPGTNNAIDFFVNNSAIPEGSNGPGVGSLHVMTLDSGKVGIGTTSPGRKLHLSGTGSDGAGQTDLRVTGTGPIASGITLEATGTGGRTYSWLSTADNTGNGGSGPGRLAVFDVTAGAYRLVIDATGQVGIGTFTPDRMLSVNGTASKQGGGSWDSFSDERLKNIKGRFTPGLKAVMQLQPLRYEYKPDNALGLKSTGEHIGFGAQAVQKIIPEAVSTNDQGYLLVNNDPILWTMLNAVKEQQQTIEQLKQQNYQLKARNSRTVARLAAIETTVKRMVHARSRRHN